MKDAIWGRGRKQILWVVIDRYVQRFLFQDPGADGIPDLRESHTGATPDVARSAGGAYLPPRAPSEFVASTVPSSLPS